MREWIERLIVCMAISTTCSCILTTVVFTILVNTSLILRFNIIEWFSAFTGFFVSGTATLFYYSKPVEEIRIEVK